MLVEVICFSVALYIVVRLWYDNYTKTWKDFEQVPLPRYTLLGHIPGMMKMSNSQKLNNIHKWLENSKKDSVMMWVGWCPVLFTRNRELFENILTSNKHISKSESYWFLQDWVDNSMILRDGDSWRKRRKLLTPSFHFTILQDFVKTMEKHALELVHALKVSAETEKTFNAFKIMKMYAIGIMCETIMGVESNIIKTAIDDDSGKIAEEDRRFLDVVHTTDRMQKTMILRDRKPLYWFKAVFKLLPAGAQYYADLQKIKGFAMGVIEKRIKELETRNSTTPESINTTSDGNAKPGKDASRSFKKATIFTDTMLSLYKNGDITVEDILNETQAFIAAGYETTATALSWCLYLLGRYKAQQDMAHEEAKRVKALNLPITEALRELHYIESVIKEGMRIHPPAGLIGRKLLEDSQLGSQYYPRGTNFILSIYETQRDAKSFEEPKVFKPERFLRVEDGVSVKENYHYTFVPFSAGPRNCIGQRFAMMEMKISLFYILSEYEVIATQKEEDLRESISFIHDVENKNGLEIKFRKR